MMTWGMSNYLEAALPYSFSGFSITQFTTTTYLALNLVILDKHPHLKRPHKD
jgi:hypothetical protein